jgi:hypothetical protein
MLLAKVINVGWLIIMWLSSQGLAQLRLEPRTNLVAAHSPTTKPISLPATCLPTVAVTPVPPTVGRKPIETTQKQSEPLMETYFQVPLMDDIKETQPQRRPSVAATWLEIFFYACGVTVVILLLFPALSSLTIQVAHQYVLPLLAWIRIGGGLALMLTMCGHFLKVQAKNGNLSKLFPNIQLWTTADFTMNNGIQIPWTLILTVLPASM